MKIQTRILSIALLFTTVGSTSATLASDTPTSLILHSTMDDAQSIWAPETAIAVYSTMGEAVPGPENASFEPGRFDTATRMDMTGFVPVWPVDGPVRFRGENFDFADPDQDGGRLDFWVKFNEDPHATTANTWLARTNWPVRYINYEWSSSGGTADMMIDVYGEIPHNYRTNYEKFRVFPRWWSVYENIRAGEWHVFTFLWRNNGGEHKDEIHLFIDGTNAGCNNCSDFNGNLPPVGAVTDFFFSPLLYDDYLLFSIDEVYSFDSWDVSGISGNFPVLQIPEGVVLKFPMDNRGPQWGSPVPDGAIEFEFTVNDYQNEDCDCDLYVDDFYSASVRATSGAHTGIAPAGPVPKGSHTWQVRCDGGRLVSPVYQFEVQADVPNVGSSIGRSKRIYQPERN